VATVKIERLLVFGDIHGKWEKFLSAYEKVNFNPEKDMLIFLGDYLDRGENTVSVMDWVLEHRGRENMLFLKGNHEAMFYEALKPYREGLRDWDEVELTYELMLWLPNGGKATLKAGEHELKLEITNDWIDIDYVEFKAVAKDDPPIRIANVRFGMTEAESNFTLFDMQGHFVTNFKAAGMDAAVDMVRHGFKGIRQGVYLVRGPGKLGMKKVSVF
jgi:hypothetical protein